MKFASIFSDVSKVIRPLAYVVTSHGVVSGGERMANYNTVCTLRST